MNKENDFFSVISEVESIHPELREVADALLILEDSIEKEGFQSEDNFEEWVAINFSKRLPLYMSTLSVIRRDLNRTIDELYVAINALYAASGERNEPNVSEVGKA